MNARFEYPAILTPDEEDGGFTVAFVDLPEAITQGDSIKECIEAATDCLEEAIASRILDGEEIPVASKCEKGQYDIELPLQMAFKAMLYLRINERKIKQIELAKQIDVDVREVRRMLDPHHGTKLASMEKALHVLGTKINLSFS